MESAFKGITCYFPVHLSANQPLLDLVGTCLQFMEPIWIMNTSFLSLHHR